MYTWGAAGARGRRGAGGGRGEGGGSRGAGRGGVAEGGRDPPPPGPLQPARRGLERRAWTQRGGGGFSLASSWGHTWRVIYEVKVLNEATSWRPDPAL